MLIRSSVLGSFFSQNERSSEAFFVQRGVNVIAGLTDYSPNTSRMASSSRRAFKLELRKYESSLAISTEMRVIDSVSVEYSRRMDAGDGIAFSSKVHSVFHSGAIDIVLTTSLSSWTGFSHPQVVEASKLRVVRISP